jgi:hypothetical protein
MVLWRPRFHKQAYKKSSLRLRIHIYFDVLIQNLNTNVNHTIGESLTLYYHVSRFLAIVLLATNYDYSMVSTFYVDRFLSDVPTYVRCKQCVSSKQMMQRLKVLMNYCRNPFYDLRSYTA